MSCNANPGGGLILGHHIEKMYALSNAMIYHRTRRLKREKKTGENIYQYMIINKIQDGTKNTKKSVHPFNARFNQSVDHLTFAPFAKLNVEEGE